MTITTVRQLQAAERAAKDAFWAAAGPSGSKVTVQQKALWTALTKATKARQTALAEYAAALAA